MPRTFKAMDLSFLTDIKLRTWLLQLARNFETPSGTLAIPTTPISGGVTIINTGLAFVNDILYGALLNQGTGWAKNRLSFRPNTSINPLVVDVKATKRAHPFVVLTQADGYVLRDAQTTPAGAATPHYWQSRMSPRGIPFTEDLGTVPSNPNLTLT